MNRRISDPVPKTDDSEKISGRAAYVGDMTSDGMLHARTLRSTKARAWIRAIRIPPLPHGYFIVDKDDVPVKNRVKMIFDDQPYFADGAVNYIGEPILLATGPEKAVVMDILSNIAVEYEDIAPVLTTDEAAKDGPPAVYGSDNCFARYAYKRGEPEEAFKKAKTLVEHTYETGYQEQLYMEPQGVLAEYEDGRVTIHGSMQCPYYIKNALTEALGMDKSKIRVVQAATGGAFGGKEEYPSIIAGHAALAAVKSGRPVRLIFERGEDIETTTKRHPSVIRLRTALDEKNRITALSADITLNAGAYAGLSSVVLQRAMFNIAGVYNIPAMDVRGRAMATNTVPTGAFRGFGAPQAIFAIETHMNDIARTIGEDPLDFKIRHMVKQGDLTATGGTHRESNRLPELIAAVEKLSGYRQKKIQKTMGKSCGIGISLSLHGCGFTGSGERDHIKAVVKLRKTAAKQVEILISSTDMGQGTQTTLRKVVAQAMDLPLESVIYPLPDTDRAPDSGPTVASRTAMIVGRLLEEAAKELKKHWDEPGETQVTRTYSHPPEMAWDDATFSGDAYPAYSWGVTAVEVEVDPLTFELDIKNCWSAFDVGEALDERIIRGQIDGGMLQGLGYGAIEVMQGKGGRLMQRTLTDYIIPTSKDHPHMETMLLNHPYPGGPFGARGAGELPLIGAAPALTAAVSDALDIPIRKLPVTPEYLMEAVK